MNQTAGRGAAPRSSTVLRAGLIERLRQRFDARLTTVLGGAGIGKTTLLSQALVGVGEHPDDHLDVWYPCTVADREPGRLLARIVDACADALDEYRPVGDVDLLVALTDIIVSAAPAQVCVVLDDVHLFESGDVLDTIIAALPANGHVLLSGRRLPALTTARLDARGELLEIKQHELLLTDDELVEFARQRTVDVAQLQPADRWPAFVELAARGTSTDPRDYLEQEAINGIDPERLRALAVFAFVGGGDDQVADAVAGVSTVELLDGLPLVRWTAEHAQLHDLWVDLLDDVLTDEERNDAAAVVGALHLERHDYDSAIVLGTTVGNQALVEDALARALRDGIDGGLTVAQLRRWADALPDDARARPIGQLLRGVIEREQDPTSLATIAALEQATDGFAAEQDDEMQLVALFQLGYVMRVANDPSRLAPVIERAQELAERYPPARPFLAFGEGWTALATGRPDHLLRAMESIADAELSPVWQASRAHLTSHALFSLGRPDEALELAPLADESLPIPVPGALITRSQCLWFSGRPDEAFARPLTGLDPRHGARDRFIAGAWTAMMQGWTGNIGEAQAARRMAMTHAGDLPSTVVSFQLVGLDLLIRLSEGDEPGVATDLTALIDAVPLGAGAAEQTLRTLIAIPYVLVPGSREYWDTAELGPSIRQGREIARAFIAARDGELRQIAELRWREPGFTAANLPVRWAVEFGLYGVEAGRADGRRLIHWLCEHWGTPARDALRGWVGDGRLGSHASDVMAHTPIPPEEHVRVRLLGTTALDIDDYPSADPDWRRERVRALLVWLVLRGGGVREQIAGTLWPDVDTTKANRNLRTTLNYLHRVLEPRRGAGVATWFVRVDGPNISLNRSLDVDSWRFVDLLDQAEAAESNGRVTDALPILLEAIGLYGGDLSPDLDAEWLDLERIHLRSRFVRAACRASEILVATRRSPEAVDVAQAGLQADPWHARSYDALASAYAELGDLTAARNVRTQAVARLGQVDT